MIFSRTQTLFFGIIISAVFVVSDYLFFRNEPDSFEVFVLIFVVALVLLRPILRRINLTRNKSLRNLDAKISKMTQKDYVSILIVVILVAATLMFLMN